MLTATGLTIADAIRENGGITYHMLTGHEPDQGYALSVHPERETQIPLDQFHLGHVIQFRERNRDLLVRTDNYLGAWVEDGVVYLDIATVEMDLNRALELARLHDQLSIFNLGTFETIYLEQATEQAA